MRTRRVEAWWQNFVTWYETDQPAAPLLDDNIKSQPLIGRSAHQLQPLCLFQSLKEAEAKAKSRGTTEVRRRLCLHPTLLLGSVLGLLEEISSFLLHQAHLGVTEELHLVKFVADFWHPGLDCTIEVSVCSPPPPTHTQPCSTEWLSSAVMLQASSLPVVVISSSNQVASAWASIMWCSMLCTSQPVVNTHHRQKTSCVQNRR